MFTTVRCSDFGYLASSDGCCDDAEDFLMEVLGGESYNSLCRVGLRVAGVQHAGLRNYRQIAVHTAFNFEHERVRSRDSRLDWRGRDAPIVYMGQLQQREESAA
jgi:hypothetical protein